MNSDQRDFACDRAYRDHAADVYRVAYGILRNTDEALDATHDAFARAWERWDQYDNQRPLRPWLIGIVVHVALDLLRRGRIRRLVGPAASGSSTSLTGDPATAVVERRIVEEAMAGLPPDARAALVLRHYYGYDYAQIGELLGKPSGTVGSILSRAHATLRGRLGEGSDSTAGTARPTDIPTHRPSDPLPDSRRQ